MKDMCEMRNDRFQSVVIKRGKFCEISTEQRPLQIEDTIMEVNEVMKIMEADVTR